MICDRDFFPTLGVSFDWMLKDIEWRFRQTMGAKDTEQVAYSQEMQTAMKLKERIDPDLLVVDRQLLHSMLIFAGNAFSGNMLLASQYVPVKEILLVLGYESGQDLGKIVQDYTEAYGPIKKD